MTDSTPSRDLVLELVALPEFQRGELEPVLRFVTACCIDVLRADRAYVWRLQDATSRRITVSAEVRSAVPGQAPSFYAEALSPSSNLDRVLASEVGGPPLLMHSTDSGLPLQLQAPIFSAGSVCGALCLESDSPRHWSQSELDTCTGLATLLGMLLTTSALKDRRTVNLRVDEIYQKAIAAAGAAPYIQTYDPSEYTFMGRQITRLTGYTPEEFTPQLLDEIVREYIVRGPGTGMPLDEAIARARHGEFEFWQCDMAIETKSGDLRWISEIAVESIGESGYSEGSTGLLLDITDRMLLEKEIRRVEQVYRNAMTAAGAIPYVHSYFPVETYTFLDSRIADLTGYPLEMITPDFLASIVLEDVALGENLGVDQEEAIARSRAGQVKSWLSEFSLRAKSGAIVWISDSAVEMIGADGVAYGSVGMFQDITERKRAEETLRRRDLLLGCAASVSQMLLAESDWRAALQHAMQLVGKASGQDRAYLFEFSDTAQTGECLASQLFEWVAEGVSPQLDNPQLQGLPFSSLAPQTFDQLLKGMSVCSLVRELSPNEREILESQGIISILLTPLLVNGRLWGFIGFDNCHEEYEWSDGEQAALTTIASAIGGALARVQAEEEKAQLESHLQQAQKMESVGRLAGGVAHDFNNIVGVILGHAELALEQVDATHPICKDLNEIRKAAQRSADLTRQLLAFARKQTVAPRALDLNNAVEGMLNMLRRLIGEDIRLCWEPEAIAWTIRIDPSQVDQILANLCVNARDAITGNGVVTIRTENIAVGGGHAFSGGLSPGDYVMLSVADTGHGMDRDTLSHLFEPFFTTKAFGKGTGLGLATVYGAVKQNHGSISVSSEPGVGTTFQLYFPRLADAMAPSSSGEAAEDAAVGGRETVLVVEDEPSILELTIRLLQQLGYNAMAANGPEEAIQLARGYNGNIDLLLTDVIMPQMNGRDLAERILALHTGARCLYMSGYTADIISHHGALDEGTRFLQKPFTSRDLAKRVREALDAG